MKKVIDNIVDNVLDNIQDVIHVYDHEIYNIKEEITETKLNLNLYSVIAIGIISYTIVNVYKYYSLDKNRTK
jgi:hypothetical protein